MTNDSTDHVDCWGCVVRGKLLDALAGVDPNAPLEPIVDAVLRELTLAELCQCAGETLRAWAEEERQPPPPRRLARWAEEERLARLARGDHGDC
jgi:hypothetical protein